MVVKIGDFAEAYQCAVSRELESVTKSQAISDCSALLNVLKKALVSGMSISFHGIGSLVVKKRKATQTKLPNGQVAYVREAITCSMIKVIRKNQVNLHNDKKLLSSKIKKELNASLKCQIKTNVLYSVFKKFLNDVRIGKYSAFYLHKFGRFSTKSNGAACAVKFSPSKELKSSLQSLLQV